MNKKAETTTVTLEEIIELAHKSIELGKPEVGIQLLVDVLQQVAKVARTWVSTEERLPPAGQMVLVDGGVAKVDNHGVWWSLVGDVRPITRQVQRWMDLPN